MLRNARKSPGENRQERELVAQDASGSVSTTTGLKNDHKRNAWDWDPVMAIDDDNDQLDSKGQSIIKCDKPRSIVSQHFSIEIVAPDCKRARCKYCDKSLAFVTRSKRVGSSHLRRHVAIHQKTPSDSIVEDHEQSSHEEVDQSKRIKLDEETNPNLAPRTKTIEESFLLNVKVENASDRSLKGIKQAVLKTSQPPSSSISPASKSSTSAEIPVQFSSDLVTMTETCSISRKLIAELSSRTRLKHVSIPSACQISSSEQAPGSDFIQRQKEELAAFLNMSLEAIHQANSFNIVDEIILTLLEHDINDFDRSVLMKLQSHLVESKESIPDAIYAIETARTSISTLTRIIKVLDAKLDQRQDQLISLETQVSRISNEEGKLEAEIQRLIVQKNELVTQKKSAVSELEQINQEVFRDLTEWRIREEERIQANENWIKGTGKLAQANASWKLLKENLGL